MAALNQKPIPIYTHEGGVAKRIPPLAQLRRSVLACMLWEDDFYENGVTVANRIIVTVGLVAPAQVLALIKECRSEHGIRHASLLLAVAASEHFSGKIVADCVEAAVQRADEPMELLSMYWRNGRKPLDNQVRKGLARAILKFDAYQLGKYNRTKKAITLADVIRLCHPKAKTPEQSLWFKQILEGTLPSPDTWEVALSGGADKKKTFTRLLQHRKLGYLALLRNLRNMSNAGVDYELIRHALTTGDSSRILPFRFVAAARACPQFESILDIVMLEELHSLPKLTGRTVVLVDISGSMSDPLSKKSDLRRIDAAAALASMVHAEQHRTFVFNTICREVPARKGMAGVDAIVMKQGGGTALGAAIAHVKRVVGHACDRLIIITDEQSHDRVPDAWCRSYLINVGACKNGVGYGPYTHLDGFSEKVLHWVYEYERELVDN